ncbi:hypothetical protein NUW87_04860 [Corynebacterium pilbarense]|uniref:Uncharacterized protein n=1 Tax=Corynebacterium pilbarense TaxID=1288393 RepID=A0A9Q4NRC2_9CORY|nr:hypothetical protein [Corynebacterium pilbarense]MCZ2220704.1 hypothetical protein [Corynebacterium pilbarense]
MNIPKFNPADLKVDVNTIGAVLGILALIAAIVGGVVGSGALNDQSGSSRGASHQMVEIPADKPAPSQPEEEAKPNKPEAETEPSTEAESEPEVHYLSPAEREASERLQESIHRIRESIRRQEEISRQMNGEPLEAEEVRS